MGDCMVPQGDEEVTPELADMIKLYQGRQQDIKRIPAEFGFHNKVRALHQAPPLQLSPELTKMAMDYAAQLQKMNKLVHSGAKYKDQDLGENIAHQEGSKLFSQCWYDEEQKYDYLSGNITEAGHFTQMVWKDSKFVGIGIAGDFCVANYYPAGNYESDTHLNVLRKKS